MRASREEKREAVSEFLPSVTISGYNSSKDSFNSNFRTYWLNITNINSIYSSYSVDK